MCRLLPAPAAGTGTLGYVRSRYPPSHLSAPPPLWVGRSPTALVAGAITPPSSKTPNSWGPCQGVSYRLVQAMAEWKGRDPPPSLPSVAFAPSLRSLLRSSTPRDLRRLFCKVLPFKGYDPAAAALGRAAAPIAPRSPVVRMRCLSGLSPPHYHYPSSV